MIFAVFYVSLTMHRSCKLHLFDIYLLHDLLAHAQKPINSPFSHVQLHHMAIDDQTQCQ